MDNTIHDDEGLFRRMDNNPNYLKPGTNRPSSALFKDSNGVSVNRCNHRCKDDILRDEERLHEFYAKGTPLISIVSVQMQFCNGLLVEYNPLNENEHHSIIRRDRDTIKLTDSQARNLAKNCVVEKSYTT